MYNIKIDVWFILKLIFYIIFFINFLPFATAITTSIKSTVEGEGFHRTLKYYVDTGDFNNNTCYIAVHVQLPPSLYVNIDELADLRRLQKMASCSDGEIDVELFAEKAYHQNVTICSRLTSTNTILSVPIHQRYHFAAADGEPIAVKIRKPHLLIGCKDRIKEHRVSKTVVCWPCIEYAKKWRDVSYTWEGDGDFVWHIPVGDTTQKFKVTCITLLITLSGAAYVFWVVCKSFKLPKEKSKDN